ncbi:MAG: hypothetical protein WA817_16405 [Candidatus Acidiferrum sp.]
MGGQIDLEGNPPTATAIYACYEHRVFLRRQKFLPDAMARVGMLSTIYLAAPGTAEADQASASFPLPDSQSGLALLIFFKVAVWSNDWIVSGRIHGCY